MTQRKKRKRQQPGRFFNILAVIIVLLIIFEGNILINMFKKENIKKNIEVNETETSRPDEQHAAGSMNTNRKETEIQTEAAPAIPDSPAVVQGRETSVDDSYFSDAVFVGDSRMEGIRNQSGITTGTFLTGVGMNATNVFETPFIASESGNITIYQALYNSDYKKVYMMLGTNDLGEFDYDKFKEDYRICVGEIRKILPDAIFYVIEVPYVEESKVTTGDFITNENIDRMNGKILELCEDNNYNYIAVNEVLSDGKNALKEGASSDGVHIYDSYCILWLDYLKSHYVDKNGDSAADAVQTNLETNRESEENTASVRNTETETSTESETSTETETNTTPGGNES